MKLAANIVMSSGKDKHIRTIVEGADTLHDIGVNALLSIDGATSRTGICLLDASKAEVICTFRCTRDADETPVEFKVAMKEFISKILENNRNITQVCYEEPFIGHASAVSNLFMLRSMVEEIKVESKGKFSYVNDYYINNKRWKKLYLWPKPLPQGTELEKQAVRNKMLEDMPYLSELTQDEIDATAMGIVACTKLRNGKDITELESRKAVRRFQFNAEFLGAEDDESMCSEIMSVYGGPESVLDNGVEMVDLKRNEILDDCVCRTMGSEDKLVIVKFSGQEHGDTVLKYRLGMLSNNYPYIYALTWRKTRRNHKKKGDKNGL